MSSSNRPVEGSVEHSGSTASDDRDGAGTPAQPSTAPTAEAAATPIYDELVARFGLPHLREEPEHRTDSAPVDVTLSGVVDAEQSEGMRPAC
ncbi:hypothetical protein [Lentzea jiangxiensis]|uniref:Uncharacterized protein n=1 Tax=Lentzea jiangxiensis TaxID=641025 RepID=A0A1H0VR08_9PSEU|nr:hypothetical protein [Lentzea jiangxiensis]SDP81049.1 hypothetical protein SAMN05421507_11592 [Lentzea jiangxiensis]